MQHVKPSALDSSLGGWQNNHQCLLAYHLSPTCPLPTHGCNSKWKPGASPRTSSYLTSFSKWGGSSNTPADISTPAGCVFQCPDICPGGDKSFWMHWGVFHTFSHAFIDLHWQWTHGHWRQSMQEGCRARLVHSLSTQDECIWSSLDRKQQCKNWSNNNTALEFQALPFFYPSVMFTYSCCIQKRFIIS